MRYFEAESTIAATPTDIWAVLTDVASWPGWDSGVISVDGAIEHGARLAIRSEAAPQRAFAVKVTELRAPRSMTFAGGTPGIFRGTRTYSLSDQHDDTLFQMREEYSGMMVPLIWKSMPDLGPSFTRFADGLKKRVESGA